MSAIVLEAHTRIDPEHQGVKYLGSSWFDRTVEWAAEGIATTEHGAELAAEYAPVRPYSHVDFRKGIVAEIGGQKYMIRVEIYEEDEIPTDATVIFIPTDAPETPWEPWDEAEAIASQVAEYQSVLDDLDVDEDDIRYYTEKIEDLQSGKRKLSPSGYALLFGKPYWIQWPIFPAFEGKAAQCLMVLETGWGDSGNINLLFTQDAEGRPNHVWFEASCC